MFNEKYFYNKLEELIKIDSTTSQYVEIQDYIIKECEELGFEYEVTHKGGVIVDLGGSGNDLVISAHLDDIGLMVRKINENGTLVVSKVGGLHPFYCMNENVRIYTNENKVYTGCVCKTFASVHVNLDENRDAPLDYDKNVCIVLDEDVSCKADVLNLGIEVGNIIALEPRYTKSNGYIKSRFIDDKACAAIVLTLMKQIKDENIKLNRKVKAYFAMYEEIGHGTTYLPSGVKDFIALDIAPVGPNQTSNEKKVSIFSMDSRFPYHLEFNKEIRKVAIDNNVDYVMDVFTPHYGSDGDGSILAGYDIRHAGIGPGTANSHGYERTHIDGIKNTFELIYKFTTK